MPLLLRLSFQKQETYPLATLITSDNRDGGRDMFANPHRVQGFEGFSPSVFLFFPPAIGMSVPRGTNRHSCRLERQTELRGLEPPISPPFGCARSHLRPSIRLFSPKGTPSHWALYSEGCFVLQKEMETKRQDSNLLPVPPFGGSRPPTSRIYLTQLAR